MVHLEEIERLSLIVVFHKEVPVLHIISFQRDFHFLGHEFTNLFLILDPINLLNISVLPSLNLLGT